MLDIVLFSRKLAELVSWRGPIYVILWYLFLPLIYRYLFSGIIIRFISPPFGKLIAIE